MRSLGGLFLRICGVVIVGHILALPAEAQPSPKWIRVAVIQDAPEVDLQIRGDFRMISVETGSYLQEGSKLRRTPVRATQGGLAVGKTVLPVEGVRIEPERDATISINGKRLRGTLEIVRREDLTLLVVNHLALEDYLRGVLSKEAPDYWPKEALKAIAIAARTYAVYRRLTKEDGEYDVTGTVMSQDYGGHSAEKYTTTKAVKQTEGWILMYQDKVFPTFYHSTCGGITESAEVMGVFDIEPLQGGIVCQLCTASPFYKWQRRLTKADIAWVLRKKDWGSVGKVHDMKVTARTDTGRVEEVLIRGSLRTRKLSGYDFRALLGFERIRSLRFTIESAGGNFILRGHGWGHGAGMCQWGSAELARRGLSAAEILAFYYPGAQLTNVRDLTGRPINII